MQAKIEMPLVRECEIQECAYNLSRECHARAITVGDGLHPNCDTFFVASSHTRELSLRAGVGACKVGDCRHNRDFECHAEAIRVARHDGHPECVTYLRPVSRAVSSGWAVAQIMTSDPVTVTETTRIVDAMEVMAERGVRHIPVVRDEDVVGIVSDRDFRDLGLVAALRNMESFDKMRERLRAPVSRLMTGGVVTVDQDADLGEAIDLMLEEQLTAIPVVESATTRLVGIVSYVDVLGVAGQVISTA